MGRYTAQKEKEAAFEIHFDDNRAQTITVEMVLMIKNDTCTLVSKYGAYAGTFMFTFLCVNTITVEECC